MKPIYTYALLAALAAVGPALAVDATTTPVGYYNFDGVAGGNVFVPSLVKPAAFAGTLTAAGSTTLTVPASSLVASAYDQGAVYATHYVEITSGPQAGAALDIVSNTGSVITLADDITALGLTGTETIKVRPHNTIKSVFLNSEASLAAFADNATVYQADGNFTTYYYGADTSGTGWSSDFTADDGSAVPIPPGTGVVLALTSPGPLTISGEVKATPTIAFLTGGVVNVVGPVNPLVGTSTNLNLVGFDDLTAFADSITVYVPGPLDTFTTYYPLGDGILSSDFENATTDTIANTTGAVVIPSGDIALKMLSNFTVAP